jgi:hypothetical protein
MKITFLLYVSNKKMNGHYILLVKNSMTSTISWKKSHGKSNEKGGSGEVFLEGIYKNHAFINVPCFSKSNI